MAATKESVIGDIDTLLKTFLEMKKTPEELEVLGFTSKEVQAAAQKYKPENHIGVSYITFILDYYKQKDETVGMDRAKEKEDVEDLEDDFVLIDESEEDRFPTSNTLGTPPGGTPLKKKK